jgi:hypothetical protein
LFSRRVEIFLRDNAFAEGWDHNQPPSPKWLYPPGELHEPGRASSVSVRASPPGRPGLVCGIGSSLALEPVGCGVWSAARRPFRSGLSAPRGATAGSDAATAASNSTNAAGLLNQTHHPSNVIALVVFWHPRHKISPRDLAEMFLSSAASCSAMIELRSRSMAATGKAKLTPALAETLWRRRRRKIGRNWYVNETYLRVQGCGAISIAPSTHPARGWT